MRLGSINRLPQHSHHSDSGWWRSENNLRDWRMDLRLSPSFSHEFLNSPHVNGKWQSGWLWPRWWRWLSSMWPLISHQTHWSWFCSPIHGKLGSYKTTKRPQWVGVGGLIHSRDSLRFLMPLRPLLHTYLLEGRANGWIDRRMDGVSRAALKECFI